jgi:CRP/FNR family transcriptional regulator, anaerobic regulatory protein
MPASRLASASAPADATRLQIMIQASLPSTRPESAQALVSSARVRRVRANQPIWRQGERIPLTLVLEGFAASRRTTVDGQQLITAVVAPGELYGLIGIAGSFAAAELTALTDCVVAAWPGPAVRELTAADADLALDLIDRLATLLTVTTERLDGFLHQGARRRVLRVLARYRDLFFADPPILTRAQLPALVGTSREMTSRVLRGLEREGTIARVGRTRLMLLDPSGLDAERHMAYELATGS